MHDPEQLTRLRDGIDVLIRILKITDAMPLPDGGAPLNPTDTQALLFVAGQETCIASDIAGFLGVPATTVSAIVDRLVRRGLLDRARTETNRRIVLLSLSAKGKDARDHILAEQTGHCARMLDALNHHERDAFVANVTKIAAKIALPKTD